MYFFFGNCMSSIADIFAKKESYDVTLYVELISTFNAVRLYKNNANKPF